MAVRSSLECIITLKQAAQQMRLDQASLARLNVFLSDSGQGKWLFDEQGKPDEAGKRRRRRRYAATSAAISSSVIVVSESSSMTILSAWGVICTKVPLKKSHPCGAFLIFEWNLTVLK